MASRQTAIVTIQNIKGLHARASAKFVKTAAQFQASVWVTRMPEDGEIYDVERDGPVIGSSLLGLMMLAADTGTSLRLEAEGEQAAEALVALSALIDDKFGEEA